MREKNLFAKHFDEHQQLRSCISHMLNKCGLILMYLT